MLAVKVTQHSRSNNFQQKQNSNRVRRSSAQEVLRHRSIISNRLQMTNVLGEVSLFPRVTT